MDLEKSKNNAMEAMGIDEELFVELVTGFVGEADEGVEAIRRALQEDDFETVRAAAHKLRGAAGGLRIEGIQDLAAGLETASENPTDPDLMRNNADLLREEVEELKRQAT